jgi:hypothetical protein
MTRIMALAMAAFLTAGITTAYAEGNGNFGGIARSANVTDGTEVTGVTGSNAYPVVRNSTAVGVIAGGTLPKNNPGIDQSLNSLPPGFENGTYNAAVPTPHMPVVAGGTLPPNGSNGIVQTANSLPVGFQDVNGNPAIAFAAAHSGHSPRSFAAARSAHSPRG